MKFDLVPKTQGHTLFCHIQSGSMCFLIWPLQYCRLQEDTHLWAEKVVSPRAVAPGVPAVSQMLLTKVALKEGPG